jgi:hypothetical protein
VIRTAIDNTVWEERRISILEVYFPSVNHYYVIFFISLPRLYLFLCFLPGYFFLFLIQCSYFSSQNMLVHHIDEINIFSHCRFYLLHEGEQWVIPIINYVCISYFCLHVVMYKYFPLNYRF